jgi:alkaline phosphatase
MKKNLSFLLIGAFLIQSCNKNESKKESSLKPKNIILMIGDGMGITQITAGYYANGKKLNIERCKVIGLSKTSSDDELITDSSAGGTAMVTGKKTKNGMISQSPKDSSNLKTILEYAEKNNKATGLITTCEVTHATPACFYAHYSERYEVDEELAVQFMNHDIEVLIGGGKSYFQNRKDNRKLLDELAKKGVYIADTLTESLNTTDINKLICLYADIAPKKVHEGRGNILQLSATKGIEVLNKNKTGFFAMIEGSQIDWGGHNNDSPYIINEMIDFDIAVGKVLDFAKKDGNTLVIITADHETGGYAIVDGKLDGDSLVGAFTTPHHTPDMVPVFAYGPGAEKFSGIYENTAIFDKMMSLFGFSK